MARPFCLSRGPLKTLPLADRAQSRKLCTHYRNLGVDRLICGVAYNTTEEFRGQLERLADVLP